jgi:hypothetical protein
VTAGSEVILLEGDLVDEQLAPITFEGHFTRK